jgi:hypothetical protein
MCNVVKYTFRRKTVQIKTKFAIKRNIFSCKIRKSVFKMDNVILRLFNDKFFFNFKKLK